MATAGSVNCDRYSDLVVGAPYYDGGRTDQGRVMVFCGSAGGIDPTHTIAWDKLSAQDDALFGLWVAAGGDVNGDGYSDVVVGAPGDNSHGGTVRAYYGSPVSLEETATWVKRSNDEQAKFGFSVSTAGDVNGDGYADVTVGAPWWDGKGAA